MKGPVSWPKVKSEFSQQIDSFKQGKSKADSIIKKLDHLLVENTDLDVNSQLELKQIITSAKLPDDVTELLINIVGEQKTRINLVDLDAPDSSQKNADKDKRHHQTHSSSLLNDLLQSNIIHQKKTIKPGQKIRDTYCLDLKIGKGGMGEVWKALDLIQDAGEGKDKYVAIKFINTEIRSHPYALKALVREFARYKKLIHPNIVKAYELNRDKNEVFIVMEYLEGGALKQFIRQHPEGISLKQAQPIIKGMCDALEYAHNEGIVHLDFKPGNVFYNPMTQECKVIDFGIARLSSSEERDKTRFDPGSLGAMTTAYASSEMLMESEPDPRDDIYGLSCVVYELLSGQHPFNKNLSLKAEREKMRPKQIPGLSKDEFQALLNGLSFHREDRTASAEQFYSELYSPAQIAEKKRVKWLIIASLVAAASVAIPFLSINLYNIWHLHSVKTSIQQQSASSLDDFISLSLDEQKELLRHPPLRLALVEYVATLENAANDAMSQIEQFDPKIQQIIFSDRKTRVYLIDHYSNKIDQAVKKDDFQLAEQLSLSILQQYPDSMRLAEQSHTIKQQQPLRLAAIQLQYRQCMADNTKNLAELFPCLQQTRATLSKLDDTNALLTSPALTNRYNNEVLNAISHNQLSYAKTLLSNWHILDKNEINQRRLLEQKLAYAIKVDELIERVKGSNNKELNSVISLLSDVDETIKQDVLSNEEVRQRLIIYYNETSSQLIDDNNFKAASQRITEGLSLLTKNRNEVAELNRLHKQVDQKKSDYLSELEKRYKKQLSQKEPDTQVIKKIQHNLYIADPENPTVKLPGLEKSFEKKIEAAISKEQFDLAQRLLNNWKILKPSDSNSEIFIRLSDKRKKYINASKNRNKFALQIQETIKSKQINDITGLIAEIKKQLPDNDQKKIISANKEQLIHVFQQRINSDIGQDAFVSATNFCNQLQDLFPTDKQVLANKKRIAKAKKTRINKLLAESRRAINAEILNGTAIFSPLLDIRNIDTKYLDTHYEIFQELKRKLSKLSNQENSLPQLQNVFKHWENFFNGNSQQSAANKELFRKTKNLLALRCLYNGHKLKRRDKQELAYEFFMFGLSLEPINTVKKALEKELIK